MDTNRHGIVTRWISTHLKNKGGHNQSLQKSTPHFGTSKEHMIGLNRDIAKILSTQKDIDMCAKWTGLTPLIMGKGMFG